MKRLLRQRVTAMLCLCAMTGAVAACAAERDTNGDRKTNEAKDNMSAASGAAGGASAQDSVRKPVVLFFGTSLTAGYGLEPEQAFPLLVEKKADSAGRPIRAINAGLSGETTAGAARRIDWVLRTPADVIVIEAGANDALRGLPPEAAKVNLERVIATVKKQQPRARILLMQMEAPPNFGGAYTRAFRAIYPDVARRENVMLVPFFLTGVAGVSRYNQADGVHPNAAGERIVAENVWRALEPVLGQL